MKRILSWSVLIACSFFLLPDLRRPKDEGPFHRNDFGELPVLVGGRLKPFDTVARNSLMIIHGKQTLRKNGKSVDAIEWLMDVMMRPEVGKDDEIFVIDHSDVLGMMGWEKSRKKYFSWSKLEPHFDEIQRQATLAGAVDSQARSVFQREILKLQQRLELYHRLKNSLRVDEDI